MPLYEYECRGCEKRFEVIQKFSDDLLTVCEDCGGSLKKLLSPPAIQFKGTGWYVTDYARSGKSDDQKDEEKRDKEKKKTESKPEKTEKSEKSATKSDSSSDSRSKTSTSTESAKS